MAEGAVCIKVVDVAFVVLFFASSASSTCVKSKDVHSITYAPSAMIKVVEFPDEEVLPIGSNATISCTSKSSKQNFGNPFYGNPFWIQIYHNDKLIHDCGGRNADSEDSMECKFFIQNSTSDASGVYDCWCHNQITCTEDAINVTFHEPSPPRFTVNLPRELYVSSRRAINLTCETSGVPIPVISWYKDGVSVPKETVFEMRGVSLLSFGSFTSALQGKYWCEAVNSLGRNRSSTTSLTLAERPTIAFHPQTVPVFLEGNFTLVSFHCKAAGNPKPVIGWMKDNFTIVDGRVIETGSISTLILVLTGREKTSSKYSCVATNSVGKAYSEERTLEIRYPRTRPVVFADSVFFYGHPRSTSANPGDLVVLTCAAEGFSAPEITWLKDGGANVDGNATTFQGYHSTTSMLTIYSVEQKHGGTYGCQARSQIGEVTSREAMLFITAGDPLKERSKEIDVSGSDESKAGDPLKERSKEIDASGSDESKGASNSSCKSMLWISVTTAAVVLLIVVGIVIFVVYKKHGKAEFEINKEVNEVQQFSHLPIHENTLKQKGQQLSNNATFAAPQFQETDAYVAVNN